MERECDCELKRFCVGLSRDRAEVLAASELPWGNGQVEFHAHRLKLIERQMYGRAALRLLRNRVLPLCFCPDAPVLKRAP